MSKFKRKGEEELQVGAGLLSPVSKTADVSSYEVVNIDMDLIAPNEKNDFSIDELDELAELIVMSDGILQPLILLPERNEQGMYILTTGERRWRAAKLLKEQGRYPAKYKNTVPCIFRDPKDIELPLSNDTKELFSIMVTNQYRHKKEADQLMEVKNWTRIFQELKDNGEEYIPEQLALLAGTARYGENGEYEPERLVGQKMKTLVSAHVGISEGKVQQINKVEKNASDELMDKLLNNEVSFAAAEKMLERPEEEQNKLLEETTGEKIEVKEVEKRIEEIEKKKVISKQQVESDLKKILERCSQEVELGSKEYKKYLNALNQLERVLW